MEVINLWCTAEGIVTNIGTKNCKWLVKCPVSWNWENFWQSDIYTNDQVFHKFRIDWVWSAIKPFWKFYSLQWLTWLKFIHNISNTRFNYLESFATYSFFFRSSAKSLTSTFFVLVSLVVHSHRNTLSWALCFIWCILTILLNRAFGFISYHAPSKQNRKLFSLSLGKKRVNVAHCNGNEPQYIHYNLMELTFERSLLSAFFQHEHTNTVNMCFLGLLNFYSGTLMHFD